MAEQHRPVETVAVELEGGAPATAPASMATIVIASAAGTAFEWYDFLVFGNQTAVISKVFFASLSETTGLIATLALFGVGFAFRPIGALIFGRIGDRVGRKGSFLMTIVMMGGSTIGIGLLPGYATWGLLAPVILILLRIVQGIALGGEYGGAATYVAEFAPPHQRGWFTSRIQASTSLGFLTALLAILGTRIVLGETAFAAWGWRVPFLLSVILVSVSVWMRLKLGESPAFAKLKREGHLSDAPLKEAFLERSNLTLVVLALFGILAAPSAGFYCNFFYIQTFLGSFLKVDSGDINLIIMCAIAVAMPLYVAFGWLSDRIGRKTVMLLGMALSLVSFFPGYHALARATNPALAQALLNTPVVVMADSRDCHAQFDPIGISAFTSSCDVAKRALANAGISYSVQNAPRGATATVKIGSNLVASENLANLDHTHADAERGAITANIKRSLEAAGYPAKADPRRFDWPVISAVMLVFVIASTAMLGPLAAYLVELLPTRVRYSAFSLPYNIGTGWIGGFLPVSTFAIVIATGNIYAGLWYPVAFTALSAAVMLFFIKETSGKPLVE